MEANEEPQAAAQMTQLVALLTEIRDTQREMRDAQQRALEHNQRIADQSATLHKASVKSSQTSAYFFTFLMILLVSSVIYAILYGQSPQRHSAPFPTVEETMPR